jgi:hypothetical protein
LTFAGQAIAAAFHLEGTPNSRSVHSQNDRLWNGEARHACMLPTKFEMAINLKDR